MRRTEVLQENRKMRFEEILYGWQKKRLTQEEAGRVLGMSDRTFRRYVSRYEEEGLEGLADRRLTEASHRRAPVDEVLNLTDLYSRDYEGFTAKHFYSWYKRLHGGGRCTTRVSCTRDGAAASSRGGYRMYTRRRRRQ